MSNHLLSRRGTDTEDSVAAGFSRGLALATGLPEAPCSSSSLSIPLTIRTQEAFCLEPKIRPEIQYCNDLDGDKLLCPRLGRFSYS